MREVPSPGASPDLRSSTRPVGRTAAHRIGLECLCLALLIGLLSPACARQPFPYRAQIEAEFQKRQGALDELVAFQSAHPQFTHLGRQFDGKVVGRGEGADPSLGSLEEEVEVLLEAAGIDSIQFRDESCTVHVGSERRGVPPSLGRDPSPAGAVQRQRDLR